MTRLSLKSLTVSRRNQYKVRRASGQEVHPGDAIESFRGETYYFLDCYHPRKIVVSERPNIIIGTREFYPSVFRLEIIEL